MGVGQLATVPSSPSATALCVAALRALECRAEAPLVADLHAERFLPRSWARALALADRSRLSGTALRVLPELISRGRLQHIALRTREIDDWVTRELRAGATELVLLGAGFDTRAYRLEAASGATVFEVDHPATQARKRDRGAGLAPCARAHHFVPVDLEREDPQLPLISAGFMPSARSLVLFEGVTMYLGGRAIARTLAALGALCAPGSALLVTYHDGSGASGRASRSTALLARLLGEPFRTESSPAAMRAQLAQHGFSVESDTGRDDWARASARSPCGRAHERLVVARRI